MTFWRAALSLALVAFVLLRNLPGALLFARPRLLRIRERPADAPEIDPALYDAMEKELAPLGFRRSGVFLEQAPLRRAVLQYVFAHDSDPTFATAFCQGDEICLYLLTPFDREAFVLTADHPRAPYEREGACLSGGLPGSTPEQLLAVHRRRVERMRQAGRTPLGDLSPGRRLAAARAWVAGVGAREQRARHLNDAIMTSIAVVLGGVVIAALLRSL